MDTVLLSQLSDLCLVMSLSSQVGYDCPLLRGELAVAFHDSFLFGRSKESTLLRLTSDFPVCVALSI